MTESLNNPSFETSHNSAPPTSERVRLAVAELKTAGDRGASWFFWIAGLSLVNTIVIHSGGERHFIVGLGVTVLVDAIAAVIGKQNPDAAITVMMIAIGFSVVVSGFAILLGWLSRKPRLWTYAVGMILYLLDGLLYVLIGDILSAGFHVYVLYSMFHGFRAYQKLNQLVLAFQNAERESEDAIDARRESSFEPI